MFEEGNLLKKQYGAGNVFDFSLGNPSVEPPVEFKETLCQIAGEDIPGIHRFVVDCAAHREHLAVFAERYLGLIAEYDRSVLHHDIF